MGADTKGHGGTLEGSFPIAEMDGNRLRQRAQGSGHFELNLVISTFAKLLQLVTIRNQLPGADCLVSSSKLTNHSI